MPAVTVDDLTVLPRLHGPGLGDTVRPVVSVTTAPAGWEGEGFPVRRAFAGVDLRLLDPFVHLDQMGEVDYAPGEPKGTPWHPHRGFETVTYMIDGVMDHHDSVGGGGTITNGDTQWMTAGSGLLHIEVPPEELVVSGGLFHGLQLWVNLPRAQKMSPPRYQDIRGGDVALLSSPDGGALVRVIAGDLDGHEGPGITHTPITVLHLTVAPGARVRLPWNPGYNALVYALNGRGSVGPDRRPLRMGQLAVLGGGDVVEVGADESQESRSPSLDLYVLGGRPIREPVAAYGPFVMNTRAELVQAFEDFQAGRLGTIPSEPHLSGPCAGTSTSGDFTMRSGSPINHLSVVSKLSGFGRSAGLPRGAPLSAHFAIFAISSSLRDGSSLKCWMPMFFSTYHGGMTPARGPMPVRCFIARAHGRTSS